MRRAAVPLLVALAFTGCGGGDEGSPGYTAPLGADGRPAPLGCEHAVPTQAIEPPDGLILPASTRVIVTSAEPNPRDTAVTVVEGYIEKVPGEVIRAFARTPGVEVLFSENEDIEADVLVADERRRNFWKSVRTCLSASRFAAAVGSPAAVTRHGSRQARRPPARP